MTERPAPPTPDTPNTGRPRNARRRAALLQDGAKPPRERVWEKAGIATAAGASLATLVIQVGSVIL